MIVAIVVASFHSSTIFFPDWVVGGFRGIIPSPWLEILISLAAVVSGAVIGAERERHDKPAGLRTLMLVCLGSAAFTMASYAFTSTTGDSGRVAAQIVTGIGFLGAGAILHDRANISGMTTAATIWATAAVGMTAGAGQLVGALLLSLLLRTVLATVQGWEIRHLGGLRSVAIKLVFDPDHGKTRIRIERLRELFHATTHPMQIESLDDGRVRAEVEVRLPRRHLHELLNALADLPAVIEIHTAGIDTEV